MSNETKAKQEGTTTDPLAQLSDEQRELLALATEVKAKAMTLVGMGLVIGQQARASTHQFVSDGSTKTGISLELNGNPVRVGKSGMTWEGIYAITQVMAWSAANPVDGLELSHKIQRAFVAHMGRGNGSPSSNKSYL
jgi:hypothetical protein